MDLPWLPLACGSRREARCPDTLHSSPQPKGSVKTQVPADSSRLHPQLAALGLGPQKQVASLDGCTLVPKGRLIQANLKGWGVTVRVGQCPLFLTVFIFIHMA